MGEKTGPKTGTYNKLKDRLFNALAKEYGEEWNPILMMAKNAAYLQESANSLIYSAELDPEDHEGVFHAIAACQEANKEWERIAPYVQPKLKQVENTVTGADGGPVKCVFELEFVKPLENKD